LHSHTDKPGTYRVCLSDIPQITCTSHVIAVVMGNSVTLSCEVRASPSATVDWYFGSGNETLDNSTDADSWTLSTKVTWWWRCWRWL